MRQKGRPKKQAELPEIYHENIRLREKISKNKGDDDCSDGQDDENRDGDNRDHYNRDRYNRVGDFTEVLVRLDKLQRDQEDIKGGLNKNKVILACLWCLAICGFVYVQNLRVLLTSGGNF